jgi:hypothetical protein
MALRFKRRLQTARLWTSPVRIVCAVILIRGFNRQSPAAPNSHYPTAGGRKFFGPRRAGFSLDPRIASGVQPGEGHGAVQPSAISSITPPSGLAAAPVTIPFAPGGCRSQEH